MNSVELSGDIYQDVFYFFVCDNLSQLSRSNLTERLMVFEFVTIFQKDFFTMIL